MTILIGAIAFVVIMVLATAGSAAVRRYCRLHGHRPTFNEDQQAVQCMRCGDFL